MATGRTAKLNAARKRPESHAGPHGSEPITDARSVKAAWDLAGKVKGGNVSDIHRRILHIAENKGLTAALPATAKKHLHKARG